MAKIHLVFCKEEVTKLVAMLDRHERGERKYKALYEDLTEKVAETNRKSSFAEIRSLQQKLDACKEDLADRTRERNEAMEMADRSEARVDKLRHRLTTIAKALSAITVSGRIHKRLQSMVAVSARMYKPTTWRK
jgi:chromosome segregation ATPase